MTTIYLIRHSVRMPVNRIENYNTNQDKLIKAEKIILSVEGERRAELLCSKEELQDIDVVYASNCVRTLQTAKYLIENQNLNVNIDDRLDERRAGVPNDDKVKNWFEMQYLDEDFNTVGGESQKNVRERVNEVIDDILTKYKEKRIAVFSHGYAITFYLLKYCKLIYVDDNRHLTLSFKDKIIFDKAINAPELFKLTFDDKELIDIELIEYDDIEYNRGV